MLLHLKAAIDLQGAKKCLNIDIVKITETIEILVFVNIPHPYSHTVFDSDDQTKW